MQSQSPQQSQPYSKSESKQPESLPKLGATTRRTVTTKYSCQPATQNLCASGKFSTHQGNRNTFFIFLDASNPSNVKAVVDFLMHNLLELQTVQRKKDDPYKTLNEFRQLEIQI
ncbi:hypothetical protein H5410_009370 [Solanum commersonii]|uniref:Uncharacterized protein n=1 Tax=Solanum commersonii TaxID=4109 RepID=A0A9J6AHU6_SOLCO|nr:hypothetical protein H5410_009370 [Solanum commersonii]